MMSLNGRQYRAFALAERAEYDDEIRNGGIEILIPGLDQIELGRCAEQECQARISLTIRDGRSRREVCFICFIALPRPASRGIFHAALPERIRRGVERQRRPNLSSSM
jgi:hypothetical protein